MKRCMGCMRLVDDASVTCPYCAYIQGSLPEDERFLRAGSVIMGRYFIGRALGSGGFGITYIAWDSMIEKTVAIKEYFPSDFVTRASDHVSVKLIDPKMRGNFEAGKKKAINESRTLASLDNIESVTDVYDCFEENNTAYIVMEYLEGKTLKDLLKQRGKLKYEQAMNIIFPVINSLEKVHRQNLIHRDISPDNIFLCKDGKVKILDFGSARYALNQQEKTYTIVLKHGYAPVEQYSARSAQGPWTDVYAVAATLYRMITGIKPLNAFERVNNDTMRSPKELGIVLPDYVDAAIMRALSIESKYRTQNMTEFKRDLSGMQPRQNRFKDELYRDMPVRQYSPQPSPEEKKSKAGMTVAIVVIVLSVVLLVAAIMLFKKDDDSQTVATTASTVETEEKTVATTAQPTTEPDTTTTTEPETTTEPAPEPSIKIMSRGEEVESIIVSKFETATLSLENIPENAGKVMVKVDDENIVSVDVVGNFINNFVPLTNFSVNFVGKEGGSTNVTFYLENYPEISLTVPVDVILTGLLDFEDNSEEST